MAGERLRLGIGAAGDWVALRRREIQLAIGGLLVAGALGVGAYFVGVSTGEDVDAARAEGIAAGQRRAPPTAVMTATRRAIASGAAAGSTRRTPARTATPSCAS